MDSKVLDAAKKVLSEGDTPLRLGDAKMKDPSMTRRKLAELWEKALREAMK